MEPVLFNKVFVNDDESLSSARVTNRPYQEILQAYPIQSDLDDYSHGDHSICFAFRSLPTPASSCVLSAFCPHPLVRKRVQQPMKFRLTTDKYCTYCSVEQFSAPTGTAQLPNWVWEGVADDA